MNNTNISYMAQSTAHPYATYAVVYMALSFVCLFCFVFFGGVMVMGTKPCRMKKDSLCICVCPSINTSRYLSFLRASLPARPQGQPARPHGQPARPQGRPASQASGQASQPASRASKPGLRVSHPVRPQDEPARPQGHPASQASGSDSQPGLRAS